MNNMKAKKHCVWQWASHLRANQETRSGKELAGHLNRNNFRTGYGTQYAGGRGTYTLIKKTWEWINNELRLPSEAKKVADAFVKLDGTYAYK